MRRTGLINKVTQGSQEGSSSPTFLEPSEDPRQNLPPLPPPAPINITNKLQVPRMKVEEEGHYQRPWYLFDVVDPAPKYRRMGEKYKKKDGPYVSEPEDSDDLSDHPGYKKKPVSWYHDHYMWVLHLH